MKRCKRRGCRILNMLEDGQADSIADAARQLGYNENTSRRYKDIAKDVPRKRRRAVTLPATFKKQENIIHLDTTGPEVPELFQVDLGQALTLSGDWMLVGDVHVPTTDWALAMKVADVAEMLGVKSLLICGDLLNQDAMSFHPRTSKPIDWTDELTATRLLLNRWLEWFSQIVWLAGNHETRLIRWSGGIMGMEELRNNLVWDKPVRVSRFQYCIIKTPTGDWRISHPKSFSRIPLRVANTLALQEGQHVVTFHEHHLGKSVAGNGVHIIANAGGLFAADKMDYVALADSTAPKMVRGFASLVGGYLEVYGEEPYTNWQKLLNGKLAQAA